MKIAYWGSGPISQFHVSAIKSQGCEIISCFSREGSLRLSEFCFQHEIPMAKNKTEFIKSCNDADIVFVALKTEVTLQSLKSLTGNYIVMFEKPGALNANAFQELENYVNVDNFFALYNRRFYETVDRLKLAINKSKNPVHLNVYFPDTKKGIHQFYINGCHALDLSLYLLNDFNPNLVGVTGSSKTESTGFSFLAETQNGSILNFSNPWGAPSRAKIDCFNGETNIQLAPFESFKESDKMEVQEPTSVVPIRRYIPNSLQEIFVSTDFKPGFVQQVQAAIKAAQNLPLDNRLCNYTQALSVVKMMDRVVGSLK
jgi:predicted dehydrogenase